jgi:hypothetical protein
VGFVEASAGLLFTGIGQSTGLGARFEQTHDDLGVECAVAHGALERAHEERVEVMARLLVRAVRGEDHRHAVPAPRTLVASDLGEVLAIQDDLLLGGPEALDLALQLGPARRERPGAKAVVRGKGEKIGGIRWALRRRRVGLG